MPATNRGQHPDLDSEGNVTWDTWLTPDPRERDFNRRMNDPAERAAFEAQVERFQARQPAYVQESVGGVQWPGTAAEGYRQYLQAVDQAREVHAAIEDAAVYVDDHDVAAMSLEDFDKLFDEHGQPRPRVAFRATRGIRLDSGTDAASQREARRTS